MQSVKSNGSTDGVAKISIFVGGGQSIIASHPELCGDVILVFDSANEIRKLRFRTLPHQRVFSFSLGKQDTARTLLTDADSELAALANDRSGIDIESGAGQARTVGGHLLGKETKQRAFEKRIKDDLIPFLLRCKNGLIRDVMLEVHYGGSGGIGSMGARVVAMYIADLLRANLDAKVHIFFDGVGAISYAGLGEGVIRNSAVNIAEYVALATSPPQDDRLTISLLTGELLPVGIDQETRERLVLERAMALHAPGTELLITRATPNQVVYHKYASCRLVEVTHYQPIEPNLVAAQLAAQQKKAIEPLLHVLADLSVIEKLNLVTSVRPLPRECVQSLIDRASDCDRAEFSESVCRPEKSFSVTAVAETTDGAKLNLSSTRTTFADPLKTVEDTFTRLTWLRTCGFLITQKLAQVKLELQPFTDEEADLRECLKSRLAVHTGNLTELTLLKTAWAYLLSNLSSSDSKRNSLESAIVKLRSNLDEQAVLNAKVEALTAAFAAIASEDEALMRRIAKLNEMLDGIRPKGALSKEPTFVVAGSINALWPELLHLEGPNAEIELRELLRRSADHVTMDGLARIVGASEPRLDEILRHLEAGSTAVKGPPHGGLERIDRGLRIIVIPPVDPDLEARIKTAFRPNGVHRDEQIAFASTCVPSVNIVGIEIFFCETPEELLPRFYVAGLRDAAAGSNRALHVPCDIPGLDISETGQVTFPNTSLLNSNGKELSNGNHR